MVSAPDREKAVALAVELTAIARPILLQHYRQRLDIEAKADQSPVTIADRAAEAAMRKAIELAFPDHGILGEEYGSDRADAEFVWVLDPIDGTKSFITGKPLFGALVALAEAGRPVVGAIDMSALDELWLGADDRPATMNGAVVKTRPCDDLSKAMLYACSPQMFKGDNDAAFWRLANKVRYPLFGADCYGYAMIAAGWSDLVAEAQLGAYDYCACAAVVEAAGGVAVDWQGRPLTIHSGDRVLVAGDRRLIEPALAALAAS